MIAVEVFCVNNSSLANVKSSLNEQDWYKVALNTVTLGFFYVIGFQTLISSDKCSILKPLLR